LSSDGCGDLAEDHSLADQLGLDHQGMVIVNGGNCPITTKVRNIQNVGAQIAIIIDEQEENSWTVVMDDDSNDGSGRNLHIPALLIPKGYGDVIKEKVLADKNVVLQATLDIS
jgi:hypothetical protein